MSLSLIELALLGGAGFLAGAINAVAGGGSLISFPALLAVGYPSVTANVTNAVAVWPGTIGGSWAYREELRGQRHRMIVLGAVSALGALLGSVLLLALPARFFTRAIPFLILFSCALLVVQTRVAVWMRLRQHEKDSDENTGPLLVGQFVASVYGGYFTAGLGILVLAILGMFIRDDLQRLNALKGMLSIVINGVSVIYFGVFGPVVWTVGALIAVTSTVGGYVGVRAARRLSPARLRVVIVVYGVAVALWLLIH